MKKTKEMHKNLFSWGKKQFKNRMKNNCGISAKGEKSI